MRVSKASRINGYGVATAVSVTGLPSSALPACANMNAASESGLMHATISDTGA
jgi:hypothetical protein